MTVIVKSDAEFQSKLSSTDKLVIVDFSAAWCPPCTMMAPIFEELAQKHPQAVFLKVDINDCQESAMAEDVSTLPMFVFYKNGTAVDRFMGSKEERLIEKVEQMCKAEMPGDLNPFIIPAKCKILNEDESHPFIHCLKDDEKYLASKQGNQLVMFVKFSQSVTVQMINIKAPVSTGPKVLKFYVNQSLAMDFEKLSKKDPIRSIDVKTSDLKGVPIEVSNEKLKQISDLHVLVESNQDGTPVTRIDYFQVLGTTLVPQLAAQNDKEAPGVGSTPRKAIDKGKPSSSVPAVVVPTKNAKEAASAQTPLKPS